METQLRGALLDCLRADPALAALNSITEEAPSRASLPWLGISASASADWSVKDAAGREVRIALELHTRGDDPATGVTLAKELEARVLAMPRAQNGFYIVTIVFLRSRIEQRANNLRAMLFEFRFHLIATQPE
jgi:hypothetical protein